ncbi:polysaccharide deacetylase family protein [Mesobacillus maritimus]|uniref:Polysaccharide deacetylase family protein n=1 Tax=Mesobacillus maritimus TaxID=1643336 RepID=A0ABS7KBJ1_9BACI|nr:polysaccharide deacetylase family protein [Mesobacillus maritimus]MBY0099608.1 polysaccharide deacetylase family protein [Mesobacillus maritimus]
MSKRNWMISFLFILIIFTAGCSSNEARALDTEDDPEAKQVSKVPKEEKLSTEESFTSSNNQDERVGHVSKTFQTDENLNLREGPSSQEPLLFTIPKGEEVTVLSEAGSWYKVNYQTYTGYVDSSYLSEPGQALSGATPSQLSNITITPSTKGTGEYRLPILMYHAIDEYQGNGSQELYVTPENFEIQMQYLKTEGFTPITFDEIKEIDEIEKPVLITLDDGYKNNLNAYYILNKLNDASYQAKATIFMIGNKIDKKTGLSTEEIREMSDSGIISFQAHTEHHPSLTTITDFQSELGGNKERLEKLTGKRVTALAYPSGHYNEQVVEETKSYFDYAVTTNAGIATADSSPYELERIRISYSTTLEAFDYLLNQ